jgi:hypothetical protein
VTDPQAQPAAPPPPAGPNPTGVVAATSNAHLIGPVGLVIAGVLGLIGGLLPWVSMSVSAGGVSQSIQGSSSVPGFSATGAGTGIAVVLATLILLCAAAYLFGRRNKRLLALTAVLSLVLFGLGVFKIIDLYRQANDFYHGMDDVMGRVSGLTRGGGQSFNASDFFHIDPAPGLWMVAVSGLLGTVLSLSLRQTKPQVLGEAPGQPWLQPLPPPPAAVQPDAVSPALPVAIGGEQPPQPPPPAQHPVQNWHTPRPAAPPTRPAAPPEDMPSSYPPPQ